MSVFKGINLTLVCVLVLGSFSAKRPNTTASIEVFYYENSKGAYTLPTFLIVSHFQKKCTIQDAKSVIKICNEIALIDSLKTIDGGGLKPCDFVIRYKDKAERMKMIGFDNQSNIVHIEDKSYTAPKHLLKMIKRRCFGHWS